MTPILLVTGEAGSGKDTVASFIAKDMNGITIAQADPMKRFVAKTFGFTNEQLWGPSEARNTPDLRFDSTAYRNKVMLAVMAEAEEWISEVLPATRDDKMNLAYSRLMEWASGMMTSAAEDKGLTCRKVLQTLGTEWGRQFSQDMWIDYALVRAWGLLTGGCTYIPYHGVVPDEGNPGYGLVIISDGRFRNEILGVKKVGGRILKVINPVGAEVNAAEKAGVVGHRSEAEQRNIPPWFFDVIYTNDKTTGLEGCQRKSLDAALRLFPMENVK